MRTRARCGNAAGLVLSLEPVKASSAHAEWANVARHALATLKRKRARPSPDSVGTRVRLALESKHQLWSGRSPGLGLSLFGIPLKKTAKKNVTRVDILKPHASLEIVETPDPGGGVPLRLPTLQLGVNIWASRVIRWISALTRAASCACA